MLFYSCFGYCRRLAYKISAYEVCIICPKLIAACKIHCKSPSRRSDGPTMLDWFTVHEMTLSAYMRESIYVRSHVGCRGVHQTLLLHVPQIFQRRKSDANQQDIEIELTFTYHARSALKIIGILPKLFSTSGPNLVILAWTGDELFSRQAHNGLNFDVKFNLDGQDQSPPKTIEILTKVFYTYRPNLVILAWRSDELSSGQAHGYRTHRWTDAGNDNTRRPKLALGNKWISPHPNNFPIAQKVSSCISVQDIKS